MEGCSSTMSFSLSLSSLALPFPLTVALILSLFSALFHLLPLPWGCHREGSSTICFQVAQQSKKKGWLINVIVGVLGVSILRMYDDAKKNRKHHVIIHWKPMKIKRNGCNMVMLSCKFDETSSGILDVLQPFCSAVR